MARRLAALLVALAVAGCGGGDRLSHAEYQHELDRSLGALNRGLLSTDTRPATIRDAFDRTAGRFDALTPPRDAEDENAALVRALRAFAAQVDHVATTIREGDVVQAREALVEVARSPAARELQRARAALARAGYRLP